MHEHRSRDGGEPGALPKDPICPPPTDSDIGCTAGASPLTLFLYSTAAAYAAAGFSARDWHDHLLKRKGIDARWCQRLEAEMRREGLWPWD